MKSQSKFSGFSFLLWNAYLSLLVPLELPPLLPPLFRSDAGV
jgi:hypothetical protein